MPKQVDRISHIQRHRFRLEHGYEPSVPHSIKGIYQPLPLRTLAHLPVTTKVISSQFRIDHLARSMHLAVLRMEKAFYNRLGMPLTPGEGRKN